MGESDEVKTCWDPPRSGGRTELQSSKRCRRIWRDWGSTPRQTFPWVLAGLSATPKAGWTDTLHRSSAHPVQFTQAGKVPYLATSQYSLTMTNAICLSSKMLVR